MGETTTARDPNLAALWARCIAEELRRTGVARAILCPGSRNSPLLFALRDAFTDACCLSHADERSAGFLALGFFRAARQVTVVCVTSGTALANLLPAVCEADAAGLPLIVLSADRPWELHGNGAPQSMPQAGILARFLRSELALGEPTATATALRAVRAQVGRLAQTSLAQRGPVHLNVPLREPLPPVPDPTWQCPDLPSDALHGRVGNGNAENGNAENNRAAQDPLKHDGQSGLGPRRSAEPFTRLAEMRSEVVLPDVPWLRPGLKGLIVAGANDGSAPEPLIAELAEHTGFPVLADATSNLRHDAGQRRTEGTAARGNDGHGVPHLVCLGDALVSGPLGALAPDLVIQIGAPPLARSVHDYLARHDAPRVLLDDGRDRDWQSRAWLAAPCCPSALRQLIARCARGDGAWTTRFDAAETAARARLRVWQQTAPFDELLAAHLACAHPGFASVHLAASMAARHGNLHLLPGPVPRSVHANRGLAGIDGTLATFLGAQLCSDAPGLLLCGDLAFLHDLPALCAARAVRTPSAIVVLDNDGGAIFDHLAVAAVPGYHAYVRAPHGLRDLAAIAAPFVAACDVVRDRAGLATALAAALHGPGVRVISCAVAGDPDGVVARHRALVQAVGSPGSGIRSP